MRVIMSFTWLLCSLMSFGVVGNELLVNGDFSSPSLNEGAVSQTSQSWIFDDQSGIFNPISTHYYDAVDNVGFIGPNGKMSQSLGKPLLPGERYYLILDIGSRIDFPLKAYGAGLRVGDVFIPFQLSGLPYQGDFVAVSAEVVIDSRYQALVNAMTNVSLEIINPSSVGQVSVDNVSLTVEEPMEFVTSEDNDNDGMLNGWEDYFQLDMNDPADATQDLDKDGATNLAEYLASTNPRDLTSYPPIVENVDKGFEANELGSVHASYYNSRIPNSDTIYFSDLYGTPSHILMTASCATLGSDGYTRTYYSILDKNGDTIIQRLVGCMDRGVSSGESTGTEEHVLLDLPAGAAGVFVETWASGTRLGAGHNQADIKIKVLGKLSG